MIPEDVLNLLTAAVDGELTPAEAARVRTLVAESADVRAAFRQLRAHRARLRALPLRTPPADLYARIMARLPAAAPRPAEPRRPVAAPRRGSFAPVAVAAAVLMCLTGGSFWYFVNQPTGGAGPPDFATAAPGPDRTWAKVLPRDSATSASAPTPVEPPNRSEVHAAAVAAPAPPEVAPEPRAVVRDVLAFPPLPSVGKLDLARVRVPFLATVAEFDREDVQQQFAAELALDPAYRIDLFARDPARGAEVFQAAAKAVGLTLHADKTTADRIQRKQATAYLVYTDSLSADDLRRLIAQLAVTDGKSSQRAFDAVHATPAVPADQRDLREVLGVDPGLWKRPAAAPAEPKSVSSGTADQLAKNLTNPPGKGDTKSAVLLTFAPTQVRTPPAISTELRQFLTRRGDRRPTAVPVLVVIRQAAG
jgi:anti-sigma factor RsiW